MRSLKIAHVNPSFYPARAYGGPTESSLETVRHLARMGHEVRVLTTNANGRAQTTDVDTQNDVELESRLRIRYRERLAYESVAPRLLLDLPPLLRWADVVHLTAVYNFPTFPTLLTRLLRSTPLVWTPRGALLRWDGGRRNTAKFMWERLARELLRSRCAIHTTSEREAEATRTRLPGVSVFVVPNGVAYPAAIAHEASAGPLRLLALGRVDPIKGLDSLIDAMALVRVRSALRFELGIVGAGDSGYVATLRQQVARLGLNDIVRFEGAIDGDQRAERFARADLLIAPSHSENFGMAIAEALAHGVPVIASRGTPWSALVDHDAGWWVPNDPESLATAIDQASARNLRAMGARGRAWVAKEFTWTNTARRLAERFEALCDARATAGEMG